MTKTDSKAFIDGLDGDTRELYLAINAVLKSECHMSGIELEIATLKIMKLFSKREEKLILELRALIHGINA